jgi:hypothetical protein
LTLDIDLALEGRDQFVDAGRNGTAAVRIDDEKSTKLVVFARFDSYFVFSSFLCRSDYFALTAILDKHSTDHFKKKSISQK